MTGRRDKRPSSPRTRFPLARHRASSREPHRGLATTVRDQIFTWTPPVLLRGCQTAGLGCTGSRTDCDAHWGRRRTHSPPHGAERPPRREPCGISSSSLVGRLEDRALRPSAPSDLDSGQRPHDRYSGTSHQCRSLATQTGGPCTAMSERVEPDSTPGGLADLAPSTCRTMVTAVCLRAELSAITRRRRRVPPRSYHPPERRVVLEEMPDVVGLRHVADLGVYIPARSRS